MAGVGIHRHLPGVVGALCARQKKVLDSGNQMQLSPKCEAQLSSGLVKARPGLCPGD